MLTFLALVGVIWVLLMPPLFTGGACTREFDAEAKRVEADREQVATLAQARQYWTGRGVEYRVLTLEQCRRGRLPYLEGCRGPVVYASVPVGNLVCRVYRDDAATVQLHYTEKEKLARVQVDMKPFRTLPLPFLDTAIHWGR